MPKGDSTSCPRPTEFLAERGDLPRTPEEFVAYAPLVARERALHAEPDKVASQRLLEHVRERLARGEKKSHVMETFGAEYIIVRAEALLLRGYQPVPLLLDRPPLVFLHHGSISAVRDASGQLVIHPDYRRTLSGLIDATLWSESTALHLRHVIGIPLRNLRQLVRLSEALWAATRTARSFARIRDDGVGVDPGSGLFGTPDGRPRSFGELVAARAEAVRSRHTR